MREHKWREFDMRGSKIIACDRCSTVLRHDGKNKPCKGQVKISMRGKEND